MENLVCSFFGHRNVEVTEELKQKVKEVIENLIVNHNVLNFLIGSCSNFNKLCHSVVTELKEKYLQIKRIAYTYSSENCNLENERLKWEEIYSFSLKREIHLLGVEEQHKTRYTAGRASYVERNKSMINDSDYCIFYYDESYKPELRKYSKRSVCYYQPKSGTQIAYNYAKQKRKIIINLMPT